MTRVILITGTLGAGKTAVAVEAGRLLSLRDVRVAVVDLDWLGWVHLGEFAPYAERSAAVAADAVVGNDGAPLAEVAAEVLRRAGWSP